MPKWHTLGPETGREGVGRGYGGGTEGERWCSGALAEGLQCAILAQNPLLASNVNEQSLLQKPFSPPSGSARACRTLAAHVSGRLFVCGHREFDFDGLAENGEVQDQLTFFKAGGGDFYVGVQEAVGALGHLGGVGAAKEGDGAVAGYPVAPA